MGTTYKDPIVNDFLELRAELGTALFALNSLATESQASEGVRRTLQDLQTGLKEPFLFVVAGEVKAGKSSLLNALFGKDFCRVDVLPATDRINVFKYGEEAKDVTISPSLIERYQPVSFLRDFNIVDTPGTNTIVADHQTITEQFVPQADLIIFVFSVVNPWGASAWQFLELLQKRWLKNVVFVLQQQDLRDPAEVEAVMQHLRQTAMSRFGQAFPIFPVSAKKAFMSKTSGVDKERLWEESKFGPLEDYINQTVGTGEVRRSKLKSVAQTAQVVLKDLSEQARSSQRIIAADREQLGRLSDSVKQMRKHSDLQVEGFLRGIDTAYSRVQAQGEEILKEKVSFWKSYRLVFGKDSQWQIEFQRNIEGMLRTAITKQMEHALGLLESELKNVWSTLHDKMQLNFGDEARKQLGTGMAEFTEQRKRLVERIDVALVENMADTEIEKQLENLFGEAVTWVRLPVGAVAAGGVLTIVAAHIATAAVVDITGTLAAITATVGTLIAIGKRRKVVETYRAQMSAKQAELTQAIGDLIRQAIDVFYQKLGQVYQPLEVFCNVQEGRYKPLLEKVDGLETTFGKIVARL